MDRKIILTKQKLKKKIEGFQISRFDSHWKSHSSNIKIKIKLSQGSGIIVSIIPALEQGYTVCHVLGI